MKPFIMKFAKSIPLINNIEVGTIQYSTQVEESVFKDDLSLAIEHYTLGVMATGTLCTKAETDPTSDESTDR